MTVLTRPSRRKEAGQTIVLFAVSLIVILGFVGLAVDMGYLRYMKRRMQSATDAAAVAGASEIKYGDAVTAAKADSASNGFTDGANQVTVTVNNPPSTGPHAGNADYAEVLIADNLSTFFMKVLGINTVPMQTRAVAHLGSSTNCVFGLLSSGNAIVATSANVQTTCGIMDNANLSASLSCITARSVGVAGSVLTSGTGLCAQAITPNPSTSIAPENDPLSYLAVPPLGDCTVNPSTVTITGATVTLPSGTYCGGIVISGGANVTFSSGIYVLNGGGLSISGSSVSGTGVTFYNTFDATHAAGGITFAPSTSTSLIAPTTGNYAGILFFQDPANLASAQFTGDTNTILQGALYFPDALLVTIDGVSGTAAYTILVAQSIQFNSTSNNVIFNSDYSSLPGGSPIRNAVLVE